LYGGFKFYMREGTAELKRGSPTLSDWDLIRCTAVPALRETFGRASNVVRALDERGIWTPNVGNMVREFMKKDKAPPDLENVALSKGPKALREAFSQEILARLKVVQAGEAATENRIVGQKSGRGRVSFRDDLKRQPALNLEEFTRLHQSEAVQAELDRKKALAEKKGAWPQHYVVALDPSKHMLTEGDARCVELLRGLCQEYPCVLPDKPAPKPKAAAKAKAKAKAAPKAPAARGRPKAVRPQAPPRKLRRKLSEAEDEDSSSDDNDSSSDDKDSSSEDENSSDESASQREEAESAEEDVQESTCRAGAVPPALLRDSSEKEAESSPDSEPSRFRWERGAFVVPISPEVRTRLRNLVKTVRDGVYAPPPSTTTKDTVLSITKPTLSDVWIASLRTVVYALLRKFTDLLREFP
jgi:hypothetical protein